MCPLTVMNYHKEDVIQSFYRNLDREDIYVLGSLQYKEVDWVNIVMDIMKIQNIFFNLSNPAFKPKSLPEDSDQDPDSEGIPE